MATNSAPFPARGARPWDDDLKVYIDTGDAAQVHKAEDLAFSPVPGIPATDVQTAIQQTAGSADPALTDTQVAGLLAGPSQTATTLATEAVTRVSRARHAPALGLFFPEAEGAVGNGTTDDAAAIRAAEAAALAVGGTLHAQGEYGIGSTVKIRCNADMGRATLNWLGGAGSGTALIIGETDGPGDGKVGGKRTWSQHVIAPTVMATAKTTLGWAQVAGTVGIRISNAYSLTLFLNVVKNFEVGLLFRAEGGEGVSYANVYGGHLWNNKINELHDADYATGGWVTENKIYGTRHSHNSGEGYHAPGTRHIKLAAQAGFYVITNNVWVGPSLETPGVVELAVEIESRGDTDLEEAKYNRFIQSRLETSSGGPRIQMGGVDNFFDGGYSLRFVNWTYTTGYVASQHRWVTSGVSYEPAMSGNGGRITENPDSNSMPVHTQLVAGGNRLGHDPLTQYVWQQTANGARWKRFGDEHARLFADATNGRWYMGTGSAAPNRYIGALGSSIAIEGGTVIWPTNNTYDLGSSGGRPRDFHVGRHIRLGNLYLRESGGALQVSTNGTTWQTVTTT